MVHGVASMVDLTPLSTDPIPFYPWPEDSLRAMLARDLPLLKLQRSGVLSVPMVSNVRSKKPRWMGVSSSQGYVMPVGFASQRRPHDEMI